jgi:hypothetical protein
VNRLSSPPERASSRPTCVTPAAPENSSDRSDDRAKHAHRPSLLTLGYVESSRTHTSRYTITDAVWEVLRKASVRSADFPKQDEETIIIANIG